MVSQCSRCQSQSISSAAVKNIDFKFDTESMEKVAKISKWPLSYPVTCKCCSGLSEPNIICIGARFKIACIYGDWKIVSKK